MDKLDTFNVICIDGNKAKVIAKSGIGKGKWLSGLTRNGELVSIVNLIEMDKKAIEKIPTYNNPKIKEWIERHWMDRIPVEGYSFGLELEFLCLSQNLSRLQKEFYKTGIRVYDHHDKYCQSSPDDFILGADSTVYDLNHGGYGSKDYIKNKESIALGLELTTPKLRLGSSADWSGVKKILEVLGNSKYVYLNYTCGMHVHIGDFKINLNINDARNLYISFAKIINFFYEFVSGSRAKCEYCKRNKEEPVYLDSHSQALSTNRILIDGSVECKLHEGTFDFKKIISWAYLIARFVYSVISGEFPQVYEVYRQGESDYAYRICKALRFPEYASNYFQAMSQIKDRIRFQKEEELIHG